MKINFFNLKGHIILIALTCIFKIAIGQTAIKYQVDEKIGQRLKKFEYTENGILKGSMDIQVSWDGKLIFGRKQQSIDCYTKSFITNDTICITGHMPGNLGWGFKLLIFKDSCLLYAFALSDGNAYKYDVSDEAPRSLIFLACPKQQLTLVQQPAFRIGESVSGYVDLTSQQFYYYFPEKSVRSDIKLRAYFKTGSIKETPDF